MSIRFLTFFAIVTALLSLAGIYIARRTIALSPWGSAHPRIVWLCVFGAVALQVAGAFLARSFPWLNERFPAVPWVLYSLMGAYATLFLYFVAGDLLVLLPLKLFKRDAAARPWVFLGVTGFTAISVIAGAIQASLTPQVTEVDIPIAGLPSEFDGFRIVQLTDLHVGPTIRRPQVERIVEIANRLDADLLALTGDFVDGSVEELSRHTEPLGLLRAKHGTFFVTGNHEYYSGVQEWLTEFRRLGMKTLVNEHAVIRRGTSALVIGGITDHSAGSIMPTQAPDAKTALAGAPEGARRIVLAHQPLSYKIIATENVDLQISGHTHGGQFFPWSLIVKYAYPYYRGLQRHEHMWIYTGAGTRYWGPPNRFLIPSEIGVIRLRKQNQ